MTAPKRRKLTRDREGNVESALLQYIPLPPQSGDDPLDKAMLFEAARPGLPGSFAWVAYDYLFSIAPEGKRRTPATYRTALHHLAGYLARKGKDPLKTLVSEITTDDILTCMGQISAGTGAWPGAPKNLAPATKRLHAMSLKKFVDWLILEGKWSETGFHVFSRRLGNIIKKEPRSLHRTAPKESAVDKLLTTVRDASEVDPEQTENNQRRATLVKLRNIAILEALRSSGMRVAELCGLTRGDLDREEHAAQVVGKGNKARKVYFDDPAWDAITDYLNARADGGNARTLRSWPLFTQHGMGSGNDFLPKPLSTRSVQMLVAKGVESAGIESDITPHALRHLFATKVLRETGNLAAAQDLLGHASSDTTRGYAELDEEQKSAAHKKTFRKKGGL